MSAPNRINGFLLHDVLLIIISVSVAALLVQTGIVTDLLTSTQGMEF